MAWEPNGHFGTAGEPYHAPCTDSTKVVPWGYQARGGWCQARDLVSPPLPPSSNSNPPWWKAHKRGAHALPHSFHSSLLELLPIGPSHNSSFLKSLALSPHPQGNAPLMDPLVGVAWANSPCWGRYLSGSRSMVAMPPPTTNNPSVPLHLPIPLPPCRTPPPHTHGPMKLVWCIPFTLLVSREMYVVALRRNTLLGFMVNTPKPLNTRACLHSLACLLPLPLTCEALPLPTPCRHSCGPPPWSWTSPSGSCVSLAPMRSSHLGSQSPPR